ncbi:hypothetical protein BHM03_00035969 [Ensete ventricosum]|nr:hypothetical protein BHM03_00035969 [Ensete ventricosum]
MEAGEAASLLASKSAAPCGSQLGRLSWRPVLAKWFGVGGKKVALDEMWRPKWRGDGRPFFKLFHTMGRAL